MNFNSAVCFFGDSPCTRQIPDVNDWDLQRKFDLLYKESKAFLDEIFFWTNLPQDIIMLHEDHKQGFTCRETGCELQFPLHSARVR